MYLVTITSSILLTALHITMNQKLIERTNKLKHLGVWITSTLSWDKHISEVCKKAYPRLKMLTKLKYVGAPTEDLII